MAEPILPPESADAHAHLREPSNLRRARFMVVDFPSVPVDWPRLLSAEVIEGEFTVIGNNPARR